MNKQIETQKTVAALRFEGIFLAFLEIKRIIKRKSNGNSSGYQMGTFKKYKK